MPKPLTPEAVAASVEKIKASSEDPEVAHSHEDALHQEVLAAIAADNCTDAKECARVALTSLDIEFDRWYA